MALLSRASPEEKKQIMARLRKLGEEMKPSAPATSSQSPPPVASSSASTIPAKRSAGPTPRTEEQERLERERLDKELELHHGDSGTGDGEEESTEELKAKLEKLQAEVRIVDIPSTHAYTDCFNRDRLRASAYPSRQSQHTAAQRIAHTVAVHGVRVADTIAVRCVADPHAGA